MIDFHRESWRYAGAFFLSATGPRCKGLSTIEFWNPRNNTSFATHLIILAGTDSLAYKDL